MSVYNLGKAVFAGFCLYRKMKTVAQCNLGLIQS